MKRNRKPEQKLLAAMNRHHDSHIRMDALLDPDASFEVFLLGLDDRDLFIQLEATRRMKHYIYLVSGRVRDPEWKFYGLRRDAGEYVFRRSDGERICLTREELHQAAAGKPIRIPYHDTPFYPIVAAG